MDQTQEGLAPIEFNAILKKVVSIEPKHAGTPPQFTVTLQTQEFVPDALLLPTRLKQRFKIILQPLDPQDPSYDLVISYQMPLVGVNK